MILKSKDGLEIYADCHCGCDSGLRFHIDPDDMLGLYCAVSFTSGDFYMQQQNFIDRLILKIKKIMCIIRNKDFRYSEICMTKTEFEEFKEVINSIK